jgi:proteasome accessory factor B
MDRLERLVNLVAALIDTSRPLSRAEIGARIDGYSSDPDAFRRNFERDKELLRQMGFPIVTVVPDTGNPDEAGYRIPRELYELPDPGLDDDELAALRLAASVVQLEGDWSEALVRALRKLGGAAEGTDGAGAQLGGAAVSLPSEAAAAAAFAAVGERRQVRFSYRRTERLVDPWRLSFQRGHWYLSGWDHSKGEERLFRLDRIEGDLTATGGPDAFARPTTTQALPPPPWRMGEDDEVTVRLWVDADQAAWAAQALGSGVGREDSADGSAVFEVGVTNRPAFLSFVLGYLDHAEILDPPEMRADLIAWLENVP